MVSGNAGNQAQRMTLIQAGLWEILISMHIIAIQEPSMI